MPGERPKQYRNLCGKTVLRHALEAFSAHPGISHVQAVIHPDDAAVFAAAAEGLGLPAPIHGGETRQESVRLGLEAVAGGKPAKVLIHDGARPLVSGTLISRVIRALDTRDGAIPALPVNDTLKRVDGEQIGETVSRDNLVRAQTPQGFRYEAIVRAHNAALGQSLTDDAAVAEAFGLSVATVPGAEDNLKITREEDLERAARILDGGLVETRTGTGFDVHRFADGDVVHLGGIAIPHSHSLSGHSDADVALHALTDALLGAIADGDIGAHFPPSDPQWHGAASDIFLRHAAGLLRARGGRLVHADLTIICEAPKVGPHREAMRARIAGILESEPGRISVKATTTEGLGFTGRNEGIAIQACVTVELPRT
jgi:2-C-methyl-D-erythritol 4-phosphate cytidylyltransferase/2-C-methyl-D-erythritol 2,4-cyclodiphosphate synthase